MKILVIDDSTLSRNLLKRALVQEHEIFEAEDGMRGLELFYLEHPDLVILDLTMPGLPGMEVLAKLRQIDPQSRIIIGTADVQEFSYRQAMELGATGFLSKPFSDESVRETVRRVMETSA
jgi:two-component system, chemotaxis family, chemotaxis protein CheY